MKPSSTTMENILTFLLCGFALSVFFTKTGISVFGLASTLLIIVWKYLLKYEQVNYIPKSVFWLTILLFADMVISSALSENSKWAFSELGKYRHLLLGGLVFIAPLSRENRKKIIMVFFIAAALDALTGMLQYANIIHKSYARPHGFSSHPILFAADLAFLCGSALLMAFIRNEIFTSRKEMYFLIFIVILTFVGIILSESRGVWIALLVACTVVLLLYNKRKAFIMLVSLFIVFGMVLAASGSLRQRAVSIITSFYTEDPNGSTGNRLELWKGAMLIFQEHPLLGAGYGDFESNIKELVAQKKLPEMYAVAHAHNIFFQALATRGIIGLLILLSLFTALLTWGIHEIKKDDGIGGYVIILITLLTIVGGLSENNLEIHRFLAVYSLTFGLLCPLRGDSNVNVLLPSNRKRAYSPIIV